MTFTIFPERFIHLSFKSIRSWEFFHGSWAPNLKALIFQGPGFCVMSKPAGGEGFFDVGLCYDWHGVGLVVSYSTKKRQFPESGEID